VNKSRDPRLNKQAKYEPEIKQEVTVEYFDQERTIILIPITAHSKIVDPREKKWNTPSHDNYLTEIESWSGKLPEFYTSNVEIQEIVSESAKRGQLAFYNQHQRFSLDESPRHDMSTSSQPSLPEIVLPKKTVPVDPRKRGMRKKADVSDPRRVLVNQNDNGETKKRKMSFKDYMNVKQEAENEKVVINSPEDPVKIPSFNFNRFGATN